MKNYFRKLLVRVAEKLAAEGRDPDAEREVLKKKEKEKEKKVVGAESSDIENAAPAGEKSKKGGKGKKKKGAPA